MKPMYIPSILFIYIMSACSLYINTQSQTAPIQKQERVTSPNWSIIIHGGAGGFWGGEIDPAIKESYDNSLANALAIGSEILERGGSSLEAVEKTIRALEEDSLFNAGKGAVLTSEGTVELDASIMTGRNLNAGAVAGVKTIKHPITAAVAVMKHSPHVMLAGEGADSFAAEQQLELVDNEYFLTERRKKQLQRKASMIEINQKMGTVGCVALDQEGNITAGTSTGGTANKRWGRVGDSPIIGAGTYANNASCGVSATGTGEFFIRGTVARDIAAIMELTDSGVQEAANKIIHQKLPAIDKEKGKGGVIVVDKKGNIAYSFNTVGMLYAYRTSNGAQKIGLYH